MSDYDKWEIEKRDYSEDNPDFDITIPWFQELAEKYGLVIKESQ